MTSWICFCTERDKTWKVNISNNAQKQKLKSRSLSPISEHFKHNSTSPPNSPTFTNARALKTACNIPPLYLTPTGDHVAQKTSERLLSNFQTSLQVENKVDEEFKDENPSAYISLPTYRPFPGFRFSRSNPYHEFTRDIVNDQNSFCATCNETMYDGFCSSLACQLR